MRQRSLLSVLKAVLPLPQPFNCFPMVSIGTHHSKKLALGCVEEAVWAWARAEVKNPGTPAQSSDINRWIRWTQIHRAVMENRQTDKQTGECKQVDGWTGECEKVVKGQTFNLKLRYMSTLRAACFKKRFARESLSCPFLPQRLPPRGGGGGETGGAEKGTACSYSHIALSLVTQRCQDGQGREWTFRGGCG